MIFSKKQKMAEMVMSNHHLLSVISRFDISLGFGEKTIQEVCQQYQVNVDFFLEIVNAFNEPEYFPEKHLETFSLSLIISYLKKTHAFYLGRKIPELEGLIEKLIAENEGKHSKELGLIQKFFVEYREHLSKHIEREEKVVYPYILRLEEYYKNPALFQKAQVDTLKAYAIERYVDEHEDIEDSLFDLKSLMIKYLPPQENQVLCYKILGQLGHLEQDINEHSNMENRVLVPRVRLMEEVLK